MGSDRSKHIRCPECYTPHSNPQAIDGCLVGAEDEQAKREGLNRVCLACGTTYTIYIGGVTVVSGLDPEANEELGPMDRDGVYRARVYKACGLPRAYLGQVWIKTIAKVLRPLREEGYSVREIAEKIGRSEGKVRAWLQHLGLLRRSRKSS